MFIEGSKAIEGYPKLLKVGGAYVRAVSTPHAAWVSVQNTICAETRSVQKHNKTDGAKLTCVIMSKSRFALADIHAFNKAACDGKDMQQVLI